MGPIIIIGAGGPNRYLLGSQIYPTLLDNADLIPYATMIEDGNFDIYDMSYLPEKGDALDYITEDTPLVIAHHIYGIDEPDSLRNSFADPYFYNRSNNELLPLCISLGVPLLTFGDYPRDGILTPAKVADGVRLYLPASRILQIWDEIYERVETGLGIRIPDVEIIKDGSFREKPRHFAAINSALNPPELYYHPELQIQKISRIRGILTHELGHLLDYLEWFGPELFNTEDPEKKADIAGELATGWHIYYDLDQVQCAGPGARGEETRPSFLW